MKNLIVQLSFITTLLFFGFSTSIAQYSQTVSYSNYSFDATFETLVTTMSASNEYEVIGYDILSLKKGQAELYDLDFEYGKTYMVVTYTEEGVKQAIVNAYDKYGNKMIAESMKMKDYNMTATSFTTYTSSKGYILAENKKSKKSKRYYKMGIMVLALR